VSSFCDPAHKVLEAELTPGTRFAGYRIEALIGRGAMAEVYRARDGADRAVALKLLDGTAAHDERFRRRFLRESEVAASLHHSHIVPTLAAGEDYGRLYLAMEYVDGADLRGLLRDEGRLEPERVVALLEQAAAALDAAHAAGLVHRDVKPGNILVRGDQAYVCDFGLARQVASMSSLTGDRGFVGTIDYVSPEQIEGTAVDARTDVYSLGCVLYECLAGRRPYDRDSELSVVFAHLNEPPPRVTDARPELPAAFDDVVARALAKARDDRYASCGELAAAARAALRGEVLRRRRSHRRPLVAIAAALVGVTVAAVAVVETGGSKASAVTITPRSIAGARLGDSNVMLQRLWGNLAGSANLDFPQDYSELTYRGRALSAFFVGSSVKTVEITTSNNSDRTAEGIGPCSSLAALKKAYGERLKPNPHMTHKESKTKTIVYGWMLGKHLMFIMGPVASSKDVAQATVVETVALYDNDLASAGYVAPSECVPGTANVVARPPVAPRAAAAVALPQRLVATRFVPRLSLRTPHGWTRVADRAGVFRIESPGGRTSIEFRIDPAATSAGGVRLKTVSGSANGLSAWLHRTGSVHASAPQGIHLGRPVLAATSVSLAVSARPRPYFSFGQAAWSTGAATRVYLTPVRVKGIVHIIAVEARGAFPTADEVLRSVRVAAIPAHEITALSAQCTKPFGGTCRGEMAAGTYTSRTFKPALTFTVPAGWTNFNDAPGNFGLVPPTGDWSAVVNGAPTDRIGVFQRIAPTGSRCGDDAAAVRSAAAYLRWLEALPGLSITGVKRVTVSGLSGFVLDLRMQQGWRKTCKWSHGFPAVQFLHGVLPTAPQMIINTNPRPFATRLYLLDYNHATFGIEIDAVEGAAKLAAYDAVVKTFRFKTH
jgi:tRNA A-37 threonylcarbamoyl transferase component Bud32